MLNLLKTLLGGAIFLASTISPAGSLADAESLQERIFFKTSAFTISEYDVRMYMERDLNVSTEAVEWGSPESVRAAIENLYAYGVLATEYDAEVSEEELKWIANMARVKAAALASLNAEVDREMALYDWQSAAKEYYLVHRAEYLVQEKLTLRTLLVDTKTRSIEEAINIVEGLVPNDITEAEFEQIIREYSDDPTSAKKGGLMDITRGRTVAPFEEAAFALQQPGEFSNPVVSRFGVHLIQLLKRVPDKFRSYEEVESELLPKIKEERRQQFYSALVNQAKALRPDSVEIREQELQDFMDQVSMKSSSKLPAAH